MLCGGRSIGVLALWAKINVVQFLFPSVFGIILVPGVCPCSLNFCWELSVSVRSRTFMITCLVWRNGTPLDSRVVHQITGHLSSCVWNLRFYPDDAWGCQFPFVFCLHTQGCLRRGIQPSDSYQEQTRKSVSFGMWHHPQAYVSNFFLRRTST